MSGISQGFCRQKYSENQLREVMRLGRTTCMSHKEISARTGVLCNSIAPILFADRPPRDGKQFRASHFDGWCFIDDNVDLPRHA